MEMPISNMQTIDFINEILTKYSVAEEQLDRKLKNLEQEELKSNILEESNDSSSSEPCKILNLKEAMLRNSNLLKSLEITKARLRSRSTFSPVEQILQQAIDNYRKKPALVPQPKLSASMPTHCTNSSSLIRP